MNARAPLIFIPKLGSRVIGCSVDLASHISVLDIDRVDFNSHRVVEFFTRLDPQLSELHIYTPKGVATMWKYRSRWRFMEIGGHTDGGLEGINPPPYRPPLRARRVEFHGEARKCVIALTIVDLRSLDVVVGALSAVGLPTEKIELEIVSAGTA